MAKFMSEGFFGRILDTGIQLLIPLSLIGVLLVPTFERFEVDIAPGITTGEMLLPLVLIGLGLASYKKISK